MQISCLMGDEEVSSPDGKSLCVVTKSYANAIDVWVALEATAIGGAIANGQSVVHCGCSSRPGAQGSEAHQRFSVVVAHSRGRLQRVRRRRREDAPVDLTK